MRLPASLKAAVEKLSKRDGTSINQFVVVAVAEKIAAMSTEEVFAERRTRADLAEFDRILSRLVDLAVLGHIGSDHLPLHAVLCLAPAMANRQDPPRPDPTDLERAREVIREGRKQAQHLG